MTASAARVEVVLIGWTATGVGIGLIYLDTLNHLVDVPQEVDGISTAEAGGVTAAVVLRALCALVAATIAWTTRRVGTAAPS